MGPYGVIGANANKYIVLADGENLVARYEALRDEGRKINENVSYIPPVFIWHGNITNSVVGWSPVRVNYYGSMTGDEPKLEEVERFISERLVLRRSEAPTQICPRIFKKPSNSNKTKLVDISIAIDALRHSYHRHVDAIMILSGDGDYLPLIKEIMRNGTEIWLGAFSSGLNPKLPSSVDRFFLLDEWFFISDKPQGAQQQPFIKAGWKIGPP